jgi:hypothetical protein
MTRQKIRLMHPRLRSSAWTRLLQWTRDGFVREGRARARASLNRGYRMWE